MFKVGAGLGMELTAKVQMEFPPTPWSPVASNIRRDRTGEPSFIALDPH
jgi:hypothetical protein